MSASHGARDQGGRSASGPDSLARRDLVPASALPIAYFAFAHAGLALALLALVVSPDLPGAFFYHPRMIALVHLVTVAWLTGSILGAFYIVGPLALRLPMIVRAPDWWAFAGFAAGTICMVAGFWTGRYDEVALGGALITAAVIGVAARALPGLRHAAVPWAIKLHVDLAFLNIVVAAGLGMAIGLDRSRGFLNVPPMAAAYGHAHLAAVGWVTMMVVGLSYRLIPMMLPAAMPGGPSLALSAVFIEAGVLAVLAALLSGSTWLPAGGVLIAAGLASFVAQIRRTLARRVSRPPALPRRDWSTWQTHAALLWLLVALGLGLAATLGFPSGADVRLRWIYGVAGLIGFLAQIVVGMQGRLVPLYAWYRAFAALGGAPPPRAASELPSASFARPLFLLWAAGVPALAWGLAAQNHPAIAGSGVLLLAAVVVGAAYLVHMLRAARTAPRPVRRQGPDSSASRGFRLQPEASENAGHIK